MMKTTVLITFLLVSLSLCAQDVDRNELGLLIGVEFVPDNEAASGPAIRVGASESLQLTYAREIRRNRDFALFFELPAVAGPSHSVRSTANTPVSLATFFLTPAVRVAFKPQRRVAPWLSFGAGYALYEGSEALSGGADNPRRFTNTGALQFGGGADFDTGVRIVVPLRVRAELRDFYSFDAPPFNTAVVNNRQHNVIISGGIVLRW